VLEASGVIGGRAVDPGQSGFKTEAHMVIGCYNNPLVTACTQVRMICRKVI